MQRTVRSAYRPKVESLEVRCVPTTVTSLADNGSANTLRGALMRTAPNGTVDFSSGLSGTITLSPTLGPLIVTRNVAITGPGPNFLTISAGNGNFRVFDIPTTATVTISGLGITGSKLGGIRSIGTLTLTNCQVFGNTQTGVAESGTLTINASTISGNTGGIAGVSLADSTVTIANSTIAGNSGTSAGGINAVRTTMTLTNVTIADNTGTGDSTGRAGGGLNIDFFSNVTVRNTIVARNSAIGFFQNGPDIFGPISSADHSLIGDGTGSTGLVNGSNGNQVGSAGQAINPGLGPLANNGGQTQTEAVLVGSPASAAGNTAFGPGPNDQRGFARQVNGSIDIGAYERQLPIAANTLFAIGGAPGLLQLRRDSDGSLLAAIMPFGSFFNAGVSVAVGDVDGDGFPDIVVGATAGNPQVKVYSGAALFNGFNPAVPDSALLTSFFAYGLNFNVGANVAVGDVNADGFADIVTGATSGNPHVRVYSGRAIAQGVFDPNNQDPSLLTQFFPYALQFNVGANVAVGDVNHDGFGDIVTGATAGNPHVRVYNGRAIALGTFDPNNQDASLLAQFFPYQLQFNVGAFVAVGDVNGDGFGDIITGPSAGNPDVRVFNGQAVANGTFDPNNLDASQLDRFFAFDLNAGTGATVASADFNSDGRADILTGTTQGTARYRVVDGLNSSGVLPPVINGIDAMPVAIQGKVSVGA